MRLHRTRTAAVKAFRVCLWAPLLFCASFAGCTSYCVVIQSNPGGTIDPNTTCQAKTTTGNVAVTFSSSSVGAEAALVRAPRIFVTFRGIDGLRAPTPDDAPTWQELAPHLAEKPVQVELTSEARSSCAVGPLGSAAVPAGVYRQLRLRLFSNAAPDRTATAALEQSVCGPSVFSCLIPPDAAPQPLVWDDPAEIVIASDRIEGGSFRVLPNGSVHIAIALDPILSRALPTGPALRLIPSFSVWVQPECSTGS